MRKLIAFFTFSLILLLPACGEKLTALKTSNVDNAFPPSGPTSPSPATPPTAVTDALIPNFNQTLLNDGKSGNPQIFNISVHEVEARDFFMGLIADSQENMVVHPDVSGRISLELKNVNLAQVLSTVQKVYGYDYTKTDIGYIIYPATLQTKIFKIDRLDLQREGSSNTRVSSGQISSGNRNANANNIYGQSNQQGVPNLNPNNPNSMASNNATSGSWITTSSKTDFWDELQHSLSAIIDVAPPANNADELQNPHTGSRVVINKQTGIVVVRANPTQMREVEKLIATTENQIGRQVAIEAKILEVVLNDSHQDGINWGNVMHSAQYGLLSAANPLPATAAIASQAAFTIGVKSGDFYAFIELMESQGKTNILSSPRISTLNNQKAVIKVGQDEYFITDISANTTASTTTTITQNITWTPFFSGIALDVTPQIADSNNITLHIHPSITRVQNQTKNFDINGQANSIPMALNVVRESDSVVHAENGQIIVIGGLMQVDIEENKQGVWMLSEIPYVGNLFRQNSGTGKKSELVILLKPTIMNTGEDWNAPMENSREHLQQLERRQLWK